MKLRIILADDHNIVRQGLKSLIEKELDLEVVGESRNGRQTVFLAEQLKPDLIIMDVSMPDLNGIEATRQITAEHKNIKILGLSMHSDKRFVIGMLKAGASGYLLKDCAFEEMANAIFTVAKGRTYLSPGVAGEVLQDYLNSLSEAETSAAAVLTNREREVVQLLAEGHNSRLIAERLNVSIKTIESHRREIMKKLKMGSIAELTKYAIREGLTALDS